MTSDRTFAPWVEPIAKTLRESRAQVIRAAQEMFPEQWRMPSPLPGWSYQDVLAHLAVGDWVCQTVLRAATANERLDMAAIADLDGTNERYRQERAGRSIEELIAELEAEGEETQALLSRLTEADEHRTQEDAPVSLGEYLRTFPSHDQEHLAQFRQALDSVML
jgi:uncharacterized protein (TIGR03083 family)